MKARLLSLTRRCRFATICGSGSQPGDLDGNCGAGIRDALRSFSELRERWIEIEHQFTLFAAAVFDDVQRDGLIRLGALSSSRRIVFQYHDYISAGDSFRPSLRLGFGFATEVGPDCE